MKDCHAPKYSEIPTEAGLPIAVCAYHSIYLMFPEEMREEETQKRFEVSFEEMKQTWQDVNEKIKGENVEKDTNLGDSSDE